MSNFSTKKAYTLIEILIVLGFTVFLFSAAIQSFISTSTQFAFNNAAEKVLDMVRFARSLAISGKAFKDYMDFNQDTFKDDFVTPANYGVNFQHSDKADVRDSVIVFADNHSGVAGKEGVFEEGKNETNYKTGMDIVIERYDLPADIRLSFVDSPGSSVASASIFYSPIFADTTFDPPLVASSSAKIGIKQSTPLITRARCFSIHPLSGNPEPISCPSEKTP